MKNKLAHMPPVPLPPEGGGGTQAAPAFSPSPPLGEERAGVRRGRVPTVEFQVAWPMGAAMAVDRRRPSR